MAEQILNIVIPELEVVGFVSAIKNSKATGIDINSVTKEMVESGPLRCPDKVNYKKLENEIIKAKKMGDSVGGVIGCVVRHLPAGIGEPVFEKLEAKACRSYDEYTRYFKGFGDWIWIRKEQHSTEVNITIYLVPIKWKKVKTETNRSGGIQGGISNGENIYFSVAFKPNATIFKTKDHI